MHGGGSSEEFTPMKLFSNVFISFVGAGVLGLPYAFKEAGLLEAILVMTFISALWFVSSFVPLALPLIPVLSIKAMLLLVDCKNMIVSKTQNKTDIEDQRVADIDYGDLANMAYGPPGWWLVQTSIVLSQLGFCCAYLIFICENISTIVGGHVDRSTYLFGIIIPLFALVMIRDLKGLSVFSLMADAANVFAYLVVFFFDFENIHEVGSHPKAVKPSGLAFFIGVCVYCFEGAGMVLALENSVPRARRHEFPRLFSMALGVITALYIAFGSSGYASFGEETQSIITLNIPNGIFPKIIKSCLCFSLYFTYPVMLFPVSEILDRSLSKRGATLSLGRGNMIRAALVIASALVVIAIPDFASIMGLIGSTCCMLLALIVPGLLHLHFFKGRLSTSQKLLDFFILALGTVCLLTGTADALERILSAHDSSGHGSGHAGH